MLTLIRRTSGAALVISLSMIVSAMFPQISMLAQEATPPAEVSSDEPSAAFFSVLPVGDHEKSYFDDIKIPAGDSVNLEASVLNYGEEALELRIYKANTTNSVNGGMQVGNEEDEEIGLTEWLELPPQEITFTPGQSETVAFTVTVPEDAAPGQYISSIVATTVDTMPLPGSEMFDQRMRFAMAVSIVVPGDFEYSFELGDPTLQDNRIVIPIENTGGYLISPVGLLELKNPEGDVILFAPIDMNPVYGGLTTTIEIGLSVQLPEDEYTLTLELTDPNSGAQAQIADQAVAIIESEEPASFELITAAIVPNDSQIAFANVEIEINSRANEIPTSSLILEVRHDGQVVEEFPLASNQVLLNGVNTYSARYIPANLWEPGTYTFRLKLSAVDPETGTELILVEQDLNAEIVVP